MFHVSIWILTDCIDPVAPTNGYFSNITGLSINSTAYISCHEGYSLSGIGKIECLENKTWSKQSAVCNLIGEDDRR